MPKSYHSQDQLNLDVRTKVSFPEDRKRKPIKREDLGNLTTVVMGNTCATMILPLDLIEVLGLEQGDSIRIRQDGKRLIIEKDPVKRHGQISD